MRRQAPTKADPHEGAAEFVGQPTHDN